MNTSLPIKLDGQTQDRGLNKITFTKMSTYLFVNTVVKTAVVPNKILMGSTSSSNAYALGIIDVKDPDWTKKNAGKFIISKVGNFYKNHFYTWANTPSVSGVIDWDNLHYGDVVYIDSVDKTDRFRISYRKGGGWVYLNYPIKDYQGGDGNVDCVCQDAPSSGSNDGSNDSSICNNTPGESYCGLGRCSPLVCGQQLWIVSNKGESGKLLQHLNGNTISPGDLVYQGDPFSLVNVWENDRFLMQSSDKGNYQGIEFSKIQIANNSTKPIILSIVSSKLTVCSQGNIVRDADALDTSFATRTGTYNSYAVVLDTSDPNCKKIDGDNPQPTNISKSPASSPSNSSSGSIILPVIISIVVVVIIIIIVIIIVLIVKKKPKTLTGAAILH